MTSQRYLYPVAISRLSEGETSREPQNVRAIKWLLSQPGGSVVVVTPQKSLDSDSLKRLVARPGVSHLSWRGLSVGSLSGRRVLHAWPDRKHVNDLWSVDAEALVVIEWNEADTAEWIEDVRPVQLLRGTTAVPTPPDDKVSEAPEPLPNGVEQSWSTSRDGRRATPAG